MTGGFLQQQLRGVVQEGSGAAGRVQHGGAGLLAGNRAGDGFPTPWPVHYFLAHGPCQPVRGVILAEVVADLAGDDGVIQVFEGIPVGGAPGVAVDFTGQGVNGGGAGSAAGVRQPGGEAFRQAVADGGVIRRPQFRGAQGFGHGAGGHHQHSMAGEQVALGGGVALGIEKGAPQRAAPQGTLDCILWRVFAARRQVDERPRQPFRPADIVGRRSCFYRAVDEIVQTGQQGCVVLGGVEMERIDQRQFGAFGRVPVVVVEAPFLAVGDAGAPADDGVGERIGRRGQGVQVAGRLIRRRFEGTVGLDAGVVFPALPLGLKNRVAAIDVNRAVAGLILGGNFRVAQPGEQELQKVVQAMLDFRFHDGGRQLPQLGDHVPRQSPVGGSGNILFPLRTHTLTSTANCRRRSAGSP